MLLIICNCGKFLISTSVARGRNLCLQQSVHMELDKGSGAQQTRQSLRLVDDDQSHKILCLVQNFQRSCRKLGYATDRTQPFPSRFLLNRPREHTGPTGCCHVIGWDETGFHQSGAGTYMPTQQQLEVACLFSASTHAPAAAPRQQSFEGKRRRQVT